MIDVPKDASVQQLKNLLLDEVEKNIAPFLKSYANKDITPRPNTESKATWVARRYPTDSELTEWHDHQIIKRKVMALRHEGSPAYVVVNSQKLVFNKAALGSRTYIGISKPFVCKILEDNSGIEVACTNGQTVYLYSSDIAKSGLKAGARF